MKYLIVILLFVAVTVSAGKLQNMAVALVPLDVDAEKLEALVLAQSSGIDFLERSEIDKLKRELKLSAASLTSDDFAIDFKKIKNVRLFALLRSNNIIIFDAHSGIRLVDSDFTGSLEQRAKTAVARLKLATTKAEQAQAGKLLTLGFVPLVPVNLSAKELKVALHAEHLLQQQMNSQPNIAVLERYHLKLLLDEPNPDTEKLLASSLLIRLAARKGEKGKIILSAYASVPGKAMQVIYSQTLIDPEKALAPQIKAFLTFDGRSAGSGDRLAEAQNFAAQAQFAVKHLLLDNAVSLAAGATALNKEQEQFQGNICAVAARRTWRNWRVAPADKMDAVIANLETAIKISIKYKINYFTVNRFFDEWGNTSESTFARLTDRQQERMRKLVDIYLSYMHENYKHLLAPISGDIPQRLKKLDKRAVYINRFCSLAYQSWDYSYFEKYVLPELTNFVRETNKLMPEIKAFYGSPLFEREQKYGFQNLRVNNISIAELFFGDLSKVSGKRRSILQKTIAVLKKSKIFTLAQAGLRGEYMLDGKLADPLKTQAYVKKTLENIRNCECLDSYYPPSGLSMNFDVRYIGIKDKFRIWDAACTKFGNYGVFLNQRDMDDGILLYSLLTGYDKLSIDEALQYYDLLRKRRAERKNDPRIDLTHKVDFVDRALSGAIEQLANKFPALEKQHVKLPESPFEKIVIPCPQYTRKRSVISSFPVYRDGKIYFIVLNAYRKTFLVSMDPDKNFAAVEHEKLHDEKRLGWYGHIMRPALTDKYLAVQNGPYVMLYPLNGAKAEILDFSDYYNDRPNGICGIGNRLFLSYGQWAGDKRPGTLLEYNLMTRETKVLISTLDRSIDWPLKGRTELFYVYDMAVDPKQKCLLTLFPFPDTRKRYNANREVCYLYGYFWEERKWRRLSQSLPQLQHRGLVSKIIVESDGVYILASGLYKLNKNGALENLLNLIAKGYAPNVPVRDPNLQRYYFTTYSSGVAYGVNAICFVKFLSMFRFARPFRADTVLDGKYVINIDQVLSVGVLKKFKNGKAAE